MKKLSFIIVLVSTIVLSSCGGSNKSLSSATLNDNVSITEDSVINWFRTHTTDAKFYVTENCQSGELTDELYITFISKIYPAIKKHYNKYLDDIKSYESIEMYIGTDGKNWVVYDKFRSNGKIQYFYYSNGAYDTSRFCDKNSYPEEWQSMVSVNVYTDEETPVVGPTELSEKLLNHYDKTAHYYQYDDNGTLVFRLDKKEIAIVNDKKIVNMI